MNLSLQGKVAVVCGSSQGIGLATARELADLGATCVLLARDEEALRLAASSLPNAAGQQHAYFVADFASIQQVSRVIDEIVSTTPVQILVNNTGGPAAGPVTEATAEAFTAAFSQHLLINHTLVQAVLPSMKRSGYGRIINIISTSVRIPIHNLGVSNTVRAAVASWAKTLANEVGGFHITVNNILPGYTRTRRLDSLLEVNAARTGLSRAELIEAMERSIPLHRFGEPAEIGAVAAFLASPAASYVNGVSLPVDGGSTGTI
ncbi:MAG TPA: SDR family oxidoreductase [Chitinophagaceae bacterium]|nr:SDR family oxidoreductase [Chitinophagaceae bacterium]